MRCYDGRVGADGDDDKDVFAQFKRFIAENSSLVDVATRRALAEAYAEMGMHKDAIAELERVIAEKPEDAAASALLEKLRTAAGTSGVRR